MTVVVSDSSSDDCVGVSSSPGVSERDRLSVREVDMDDQGHRAVQRHKGKARCSFHATGSLALCTWRAKCPSLCGLTYTYLVG